MTPEQKTQMLAAQTEKEVDDAFTIVFDIVYDKADGTLSGMSAPVNRLLAWAKEPDVLPRLHADLLISCLRLPFMARYHLGTWRPLRDAVERELTRRGVPDQEVDAWLTGLKEDA